MNDLTTLKVGDKVVHYGNLSRKRIIVVDGITPKGFIKAGGQLYKPDGDARGRDSWTTDFIRIPTPELIKEIEDHELINKAFSMMRNCNKLTVNQAAKIINTLG